MLIRWETLLVSKQQSELLTIDCKVSFWPASWMKDSGYNSAIPIEWWISFSASSNGLIWCMKYPEYSKIVYK